MAAAGAREPTVEEIKALERDALFEQPTDGPPMTTRAPGTCRLAFCMSG